jgi:hypothetical protein
MSHNYRDGGKGDKPRPMLNKEEFDKNFEAIFGKKKQATVQEVDDGVYVVKIHNKEDADFDMDGRC